MSDLIHIISWERYCERDNNNDLEKYMELPLQNYPGLLDIRNLNLKNSGPLLKDLPDNCLNVLICRLRVLVENETFIDSPNRIVSLTKLLCLIARNGKNFSKLDENLAPNLMVQLIEMSLHQLSNAMNNEWLNILEYSLYFLEIIYDPTFSWRRRKKLFYSESAETELAVAFNPTSTKSMQISVETATWLCSQLIIYFNDRDIRTRLMYLLCAIASGAKDNAQFIISPATVDAFKFDTDSNVNIETIVSYCCLIYCLSEIPIAERQEELPIVVKKLLDYVTSKSEIRISELRCLYQLILVSYELSAELIRCGILNVIKICLTNTKQDPEQCSFCFLLLSKLTSGKFQAQNQFIESKGYNELFNYLTSNPLQAAFLLDLIFTWAVAEPFDASKIMNKKYVIRDGNVIGLLIRWATSLSFVYENETEISNEKNSPNRCPPAVVNWKAIFKLIVELCHRSRCSISRSCECGVIVVITECIQQACRHIDTCIPEVINHDDEILCKKISTIQRKGDELLKGLFHMMEIFCSYSIQGRDLKAVMSLFKDNYTRTRSRKLIKIFIKVISEREDEIKCWFELSQPGDCISIAPAGNQAEFSMKNNINNYHLDRRLSPQAILDAITWKISSSGFSFHCWLNISPLSVLEKVDAGHERSSLFRLLTDNNNGFEAFLNMDDQLIVATCHQGEFQYVQICNNSRKRTAFMLEESLLKSDKWHLLDIVYQSAKNFFSKPCVMVYVNGALVDTVELKYPFINENISIFHIGGCPKNLQIPTKNLVDPKGKRKSLFMSNSSVKKTFLFEEHNTWGRLSTLKCRIAAVACINDVLPETTITTLFQKGPLDTQAVVNDETLLGNILINYHARAFDCNDNLCFNLHAYIQSSRSNKYHSGYLIGEWLQRHKFEDVINEIGGLSCLLPIFEQLEFLYFQTDSDLDQEYNDGYHFAEFYSSRESSRNSPSSVENVGFITVPDKFTDVKLNEGMLASLVILIRRLMSFEINQQQMENMKFIHIVGALMQKVDIIFLDKNAIMVFRSLADLSSSNLSSQIYKFILLDWRIWSRCSDEIRQQHCLFVLDIVKSDRAMFRQQYGISLLLDALHFHHRPLLINQEDRHKKLRDYIYAMIFHLIHKHVTILDYQKILKFLHETNDDILIQEGLELLLKLYTSSDSGHQDSLLLYENNLMESLFVLLIKNLSVQTKEDAIKFLHLIITSTRTADKFKSHLLLNEISFASIFTFTEFCQAPLSAVSIQNLLEIIRKASSKDLFGVIQFLSLLTLSPIKQRISAIKMLKSIFDKSPEAILEISKQPGWQDILIHLLVLNKKEEKESVSSLNENDKMEDINMRSKDINGDVKGFRRSSTLLFEESSNDCISVSTSKFDNLLEEDEEEYRLIEQLAENADTDENMENKSLDTVFIRQMASSVCEISYEESSLNLSMPHFHRRSICTSVTSSDDISQQLKIGNGLSDNYEKESIVTDIVTLKDELIDLVLDCLNKVMWKVLSSSNDKDSWMVVHQVIESLRSVNERYTLLNEIFYFKERILMGILNSFIDLYKPSDSSINRLTMHSKELIYLIVDNSCHNLGCDGSEHKIQLLDQTMIFMQECLQVWEEDNLRPELAALGFYYLLSTLGCDGNRGIVSAVCARLHQIITSISKNINYEEIAFIIVHLDQVLKHMISSDNYYSVALILKSLLEYYGEVLQISTYLPNMSTKTVEFFDDFKNYSNSEEWQNFIKLRLTSACEIYETNYLNEMTTGQSLWRAQANERMSLDRRVRLSLSKDHRKRFENEIINMTTKWIKDERKRKNCVEKDLRMQHEATLRLWRVIKQYLTSIKGCWDDKLNMQQLYWKQSCRENYLRMRPRFEPNYQYDQHLDASKERDFPSHSYKETEPNPLLYLSALEGKIDFFALGDDQLGDDEWITVQNTGLTNSISGSIQNPSSGLSVKKTMILECRCKLIKFTEVIEGKFELTNTHFIFNGINFSIDALDSSTSHMVHSINQIKEIHLRRYNLRRSAIEIFLIDQTNYFFNFTTKTRNKVYSKILSMRPQSLIYSKPRSPADLLKSSNLTQKWITREISNFEYLMQLNTIAGRTYNDMSQYPVFPWILSDYTSPKLDLENPKTFRDLSKPIGVVNPKNEPEIREKYDGFEDPTGVVAQFHYGTHYSSAAGVMHYMVRVEPFTSMHIQLQSGKFDVADRQFHSIPLAWNFIMESPSDNKELIPEFFYEPDFLRNQNNFEFGLLQQNKTPIDDVELPAWASSPEDFIYQHQQALESEYVSQNLHHWIDLIFGYKQKGPEAVKALNVFYYVTYEGVVDLDQISDPIERESIESMINNFGQTPCQLFKVPHPRRLTEAEEKNLTIKVDKYLPVLSNILSLKHTSKSVCSSSEPIVFVRVPVTQTKGFIGTDRSLTMVTVHSSNIVAKHNWMPNYRNAGLNFHIDIDTVLDNLNTRRKNFLGPLSSFVDISNRIYDVSPDCKYIIAGGNIENRLTIMSLKKPEIYNVPTPHHLPVSCVSIDIDCASPGTSFNGSLTGVGGTSTLAVRLFAITGSLDSTCAVWNLSDLPSTSLIQTLCGHSGPVTSVSLSMFLDVALTGSEDGTVNLHSVIRGQFLHSITPGFLNSATLSINFVVLTRSGQIYIQWQNGLTPSKDKSKSSSASCSANHPKQFLSVYSLHANHISTCELGHSKVTALSVVPKCLGSLNHCCLIGNVKGELVILDGYYLTDQKTLNFQNSILDVQLLSPNGQHLVVALSNGCLIISTVSLSNIDKQ